MKKAFLTLCLTMLLLPFMKAQNTFPMFGNVGIGTGTPARELQVVGNLGISGDIYGDESAGNLSLYSGTGSSDGAYVKVYGQDWGGGLSLVAGLNGTNGDNGRIRFVHWNGTSWTDRMVLNEAGDFGIGTTTPQERLHLNGRMVLDAPAGPGFGLKLNAGTSGGILINTSHGAGYGYGVKVTTDHGYTKGLAVGENGQDEGFFMYANGVGHIKEALGIGTFLNTDPADGKFYRLSVDGRIRATEVKVYTTWADYVFEDDYELRSLKDVKTYIDTHGHLPDVPSAEEVEKNGVNLGESESILLRKIEELTLYMIEMNEKVERLEQENASLELQISK